ncbi:hypothetical protein ACH5RR_000943 [Cinchona calisaya]|uniref:Uncharacterized protein n=1 Tax=Cinchona calisaya TaxID=153742 RepID=A0ABD3B215_9GENT
MPGPSYAKQNGVEIPSDEVSAMEDMGIVGKRMKCILLQIKSCGMACVRNERVRRSKKGKEKASNLVVDQHLNIPLPDDDETYLPKISFKRPFSLLDSNCEHEGSRASNKLAKSGNEIYLEGINTFNRLAEIQIKEKEEKVNLAKSMNLAKVAIKEQYAPDPELEIDLMECLLSDTFKALFLMFDFP